MQKSLIIFLIIAAAGAYFCKDYFIGEGPATNTAGVKTTPVQKPAAQPSPDSLQTHVTTLPPELKELTVEQLISKAFVLQGEYRQEPKEQTLLNLIEIFLTILEKDSTNPFALKELGEISFERKLFEKAAAYYRDYLKQEPHDSVIILRYASSLIFLAKYEEALTELDSILKVNPTHFSALAYKSIALAQAGKTDQAKALKKQVLDSAPSEEGKDRFLAFIKSLDPQQVESRFPKLQEYLTTNQITQNKLTELSVENERLIIRMQDFPIKQMPEFAKKKFIASIKSAAQQDFQEQESLEIVVLDQSSGEQLTIE